jgi:hypothetical protein
MNRFGSFVVAALIALSGCSSEVTPAHRVGAVSGAEFWTFTTPGFNPADGGQLAAVGDIYQSADSTKAFVRFGTNNTDWQPFPAVAATPSVAGLMPTAIANSLDQGVGTVAFIITKIDCTQTGLHQIIPAKPGYLFMGSRYIAHVVTETGTSTGNFVWSIGNDTGHGNIVTTVTTSAATLNGAVVVGLPSFLASNNTGGNPGLADMVTAASLNVATAPTGVTVLTVTFALLGVWVPV